MPEYVLNRNYLLRTTTGVVSFKEGGPTWVIPAMEKEAIGIGAQRVDGKKVEVLEPEQRLPPTPVGDDRTGQLYAAFELLIEKNEAKDFTGQGVPSVKAMEKILGFEVDRVELVDAWHAYKQAKAE